MAVQKKTINLSRTYVYEGVKFGPGDVEVSRVVTKASPDDPNKLINVHLADILEKRNENDNEKEIAEIKKQEDAKIAAAQMAGNTVPGMITVSQDELHRMIAEGIKEHLASEGTKSAEDSSKTSESKTEEEDDEEDDDDEEEEAAPAASTPKAK